MRATKPMPKDGLTKQLVLHKRAPSNNTKLEASNLNLQEELVKEPELLLPLNRADLKLEAEELPQIQDTLLVTTSLGLEPLPNKSKLKITTVLP